MSSVVECSGATKEDAPSSLPKDTLPAKLPIDDIPLGLGPRPVPKDNPLTAERVQLGRKLFFDPILSADRTLACASCHQPKHGMASALARLAALTSSSKAALN